MCVLQSYGMEQYSIRYIYDADVERNGNSRETLYSLDIEIELLVR